MKNKIGILAGILGMTSAVARGMEVHEWGTFTILSASDGQKMSWYQPATDLAQLPEFVNASGLGIYTKAGADAASVRMETPVLYFYPKESTHVTVGVSFESGKITECYPHSLGNWSSGRGDWAGTLMPPNDQPSRRLIPKIDGSSGGEHYAAARAVPGAWIFLADKVKAPVAEPQEPAPEPIQQAEKFIFYRGAGESSPMVVPRLDVEGRLTLTNYEASPLTFNVALRVENGQATWEQLDALPAHPEEGDAPALSSVIDGPARDILSVEKELVDLFESVLSAEGLTVDEAKAMVETWRSVWFREPGTRVFSLVPQAWVERNLPLTIDPAPSVTKRVFISRLEILSPQKETQFVALLNADSEMNGEALAAFEALEFGRFSSGALKRAQDMQTAHMQDRHWKIQAAMAEKHKAITESAPIR